MPDDLERVLRYLENLDAARLGDAAEVFAKRLKKHFQGDPGRQEAL